MPECNKCGEIYEGDDCVLCKTVTGLDLQQLQGCIIITSSMAPGAESAVYLEDSASQQRFPVPIPMCRVGRDPQNDVIITGDNGVSRNQFVITSEDGYFYLMDLGSKNGTMLNGKSLTERTTLTDGDFIRIGSLTFQFSVDIEQLKAIGHHDFIAYLEAKQASESAMGDMYEPSMTVEAVMPEEARAVLEKVFNSRKPNSKQNYPADQEGQDYPSEPQSTLSQTEEADYTEGAEQAMTVQEEASTKPVEWCPRYMLDELARMEKEIQDLNDVMHEAKRKIHDCEGRMKLMRSLQKSLLSATGDELVEACIRVLQLIGWRIKRGEKDRQELLLTSDSGGLLIARIAWTNPQTAHVDLGTLVISQVYHWCKQKTEPKGILIVNTLAGGSGPDSTFSPDLAEYAKQKNVCVLSTLQLLYMFSELNHDMENAETFLNSIASTLGVLPGLGSEAALETPVAA
jgi:pSer/pThr/pTyr-binding forkhead associated (FHA) protein